MALVAIFFIAFILRTLPAKYGFYLNEFDPYYDYYATRYLVDRIDANGPFGLSDYMSWRDNRTWFPEGRPVAESSQVGLHFAGAGLFFLSRSVFGFQASLYDLLVMFPVVFGALTSIVVFLLVKKMAGSTAGLLSALIIAVSPPLIQRGNLGWYKSEPLALFLALAGGYLLLSIYDEGRSFRGLLQRALVTGFLFGYANTVWGGSQYFSILLSLFFISLPFFKIDAKNVFYSASIVVSTLLVTSASFPRPGPGFISGPSGILLLGSLLFLAIASQLATQKRGISSMGVLWRSALVFLLTGLLLLSFGVVTPLSGRYLTTIYPFQRSADPLIESVAEHQVPSGQDFFVSYMALIPLAGLGIVVALRQRTPASLLALILAITAVYLSSSFARLMVYSSIAVAVLGGIGFASLTSAVTKPSAGMTGKTRTKLRGIRSEIKIAYALLMIFMLVLPIFYSPARAGGQGLWLSVADTPVSIANAAVPVRTTFPDWIEALTWMRENTPKDAVFASWWDYGYWIAVMGERTSLADNATINGTRISQLGRMFMSDEKRAVNILRDLRADYVVVFVAGQRLDFGGRTGYLLNGGGDEVKAIWFLRIGRLNVTQYSHVDSAFIPNPFFWENTILGKMLPFKTLIWVNVEPGTGRVTNQSSTYKPGYIGIYEYSEHYKRESEGPFTLVFKSSSLQEQERAGLVAGVLIYKFKR